MGLFEMNEEIRIATEAAKAKAEWIDLAKTEVEMFNRAKEEMLLIGNEVKMLKTGLHLTVSSYDLGISDTLQSLSNQYKAFYAFHRISEDEKIKKERIRAAYEKWGQIGWTLIEWENIRFFNTFPGKDAADKKALAACSATRMSELFETMKKTGFWKKADLDEAIADYHDKRYKSCAMILYSLIDGKLIRAMRKEDREGKSNNRPTGKRAAEKLYKRIDDKIDLENTFFLLLDWSNFTAAIGKFFAFADSRLRRSSKTQFPVEGRRNSRSLPVVISGQKVTGNC